MHVWILDMLFKLNQPLTLKHHTYYLLLLAMICTACVKNKTHPSFKGHWYIVQSGDTLLKISQRFNTNLDDIIELNHIIDASKIVVNQKIFIPQFNGAIQSSSTPSSYVNIHTKNKESTPHPKPKGTLTEQIKQLRWPLKHVTITSPFGQRYQKQHKGIDLRAAQGTAVYAVNDGIVTRSDYDADGYGWYIIIQHGKR